MYRTRVLLASIEEVNIYKTTNQKLVASVKLAHENELFLFGGEALFSFRECILDSKYVLHFLDRCMVINQAKRFTDLMGVIVKIQVLNLDVIGMGATTGQDWFFPVLEFNVLKEDE
jgi:hypothetical protein